MSTKTLIVVLAGGLAGCVSTTSSPRLPTQPALAAVPSTRVAEAPREQPPAAPQAGGETKRPWEFTIGGAGASDDDLDAGGAQASASVGYYVSDVVELLVRQNGSFSDAGEGSPDAWNGSTRVALDLHLPLGRVVPYVGGLVGYVYGDSVRDSWLAGPEAGIKFYLKDDAFLLVGAEYQFFFDEGDSLETAFDEGELLYMLSIGLRF